MMLAMIPVLGAALLAMVLAWLYSRRYAIQRPPIGVLNLADVVCMMAAIILIPLLYLLLPLWATAVVLTVGTSSVLYLLGEPLFPRRGLRWIVALGLSGADLLTYFLAGSGSPAFCAINNLVLILLAVGVANVQAQSGLKARDATLLGIFLMGYDFIATARLSLMGDLMSHVAGLPFSPIFTWPVGEKVAAVSATGTWVGLGLGDVVLGSLFPLVMHKAFGVTAGRLAGIASFASYSSVLVVPTGTFVPVMAILGLLMVAQYVYWRQRRGAERTTRQYLGAEPIRHRGQCT